MSTPPLDHVTYIEKFGFWRWVLRECVRANPLYVISAALISYGVLQLNSEMDTQAGKTRGIVVGLVLLHVYEFMLILVATRVLRTRTGGGGDLHGLTIVAALFMGGSFLALDEIIALSPLVGTLLVLAALLLTYVKLAWYAQLPGILLPPLYRHVGLIVLAGHALPSLLGEEEISQAWGKHTVQAIAWGCGWISLLAVFALVWIELKRMTPRQRFDPRVMSDADPLVTRICGGTMVGIFAATGIAHLIASDWVFDRPTDIARMLPELAVLSAIILLRRWIFKPRFSLGNSFYASVPMYLLYWMWSNRLAWALAGAGDWIFYSPVLQLAAASILIYVMLALATGRHVFFVPAAGIIFMPVWMKLWLMKSQPFARALMTAAMGFIALVGGMLVSLYRERLLSWLEPQPSAPVEKVESTLP